MAREQKGMIARWLEGKERSEDYARSTLPTSRWSLFWDILKGRFSKLVLVNLMVLVTALPIALLIFWRMMLVMSEGASDVYGGGLGMAYPMIPSVIGVVESKLMQIDLMVFGLMIPASAIAAVGLSGGLYIIRNMVWTEGIFVANDFWRGVKRNYFNVLEALLLVSFLLFSVVATSDLAALYAAVGSDMYWAALVCQIVGIVMLILGIMVAFWMLSLGVNYKLTAWQLFRNALVMTFGTLPQTVLFIVVSLLPFLLMFLGSMFLFLGILLVLFLSFSFAMLVWMDYSQWAFDKFINPKLGVKTGRGLYVPTNKQNDKKGASAEQESAAMQEYRRQILARGKSKLVSRPIRPIDDGVELYQLPESFSREDLKRLRESRNEMVESVKEYEEEHKNDEKYVEYNRMFDEAEKALQDEKKSKKKKNKASRPKMLNKK